MLLLRDIRTFIMTGLLLLAAIGFAQQPANISVRLVPESMQLTVGDTRELLVRVKSPPDHHAYLDTGKDGTFIPIDIDLSELEQVGLQVKAVGKPKGEWDDFSNATVLRGEGIFRYQITALPGAKPGKGEYAISVRSQICNDETNACYFPQTDMLHAKITVSPLAPTKDASENTPSVKQPTPVPLVNTSNSEPPAPATPGVTNEGAIDDAALPLIPPDGIANSMPTYDMTRYTPQTSQPTHGLLMWLLLAFVAGLVLNVMPCVLPVVSIKVLSFVQQAGESRRRVFGLGLVFAAGMMTVFLALAGAAILFGLGWGQQFQSQTFVIIMIAVVFAFALSLFGVYEIAVPRSIGTLAAGASREGYGSTFMKGVMATVLATPCSGPFLGSTLAWTLTQPPLTVFLIFSMLGLGMATPYVVLTAHPALLSHLPRPGAWMETFKHIMGFFLVATVIYLMVSLEEQLLLLTLMMLVFVAIGAWIWGRFSLHARSAVGRTLVLACGLLVVGAGTYLSFTTVRGFLTPAAVDTIDAIDWEPFDPVKLSQYHLEGRSVMLDFTADWCANCTFNEVRVYNSAAVRELLRKKHVVAMKADLTREGPLTGTMRQLMEHLGARSIPFLAVFPGDQPMKPYTLYDLVDITTVSNLLKQLPDPQE